MKYVIALCLGLAGTTISAGELIPVEHFANIPAVSDFSVSPNGKRLAVLARNDSGYYDVLVAPWGTKDFKGIAQLGKSIDRFEWIRWGNDDWLLLAVSLPEGLGIGTYRLTRLYSINANTGEMKLLQRRGLAEKTRTLRDVEAYRQEANVISFLPKDPQHVLLQLWDTIDEAPAVFKVNIETNGWEKVVQNSIDARRFFATADGKVLLARGFDRGEREDNLLSLYWYRETEDDEWKILRRYRALVDEEFYPQQLQDDGKHLLVLSTHGLGRLGLFNYDIENDQYELIFAADNYDLDDVMFNHEARLTGVSWLADYREYHYFDEKDRQIQELLDKTFVGGRASLVSYNLEKTRMVVMAGNDATPSKYFSLDLNAGKVEYLSSSYPELDKVKMSGVQRFDYVARDGMKLNGYLTLPVGLPKDTKPPLVVLPHGGPASRDTMYFDYMVQLFTNRGYAVLQPNFRGSSGFGVAYEVAGYRQWGEAMQTDVLDAINWVAEKKLADTENMCLVGWSYGGYVALTASVKTPELFKCYASIAGISDIYGTAERRYFALVGNDEFYSRWMGDYRNEADVARLKANSAIYGVRNIKRPILLIHGTRDTQVEIMQSEAFYEKARRVGVDIEFIEQNNGTHYLDYGPNRIEAMKAIDEFLRKHLD